MSGKSFPGKPRKVGQFDDKNLLLYDAILHNIIKHKILLNITKYYAILHNMPARETLFGQAWTSLVKLLKETLSGLVWESLDNKTEQTLLGIPFWASIGKPDHTCLGKSAREILSGQFWAILGKPNTISQSYFCP